jgi:hypothetical protein
MPEKHLPAKHCCYYLKIKTAKKSATLQTPLCLNFELFSQQSKNKKNLLTCTGGCAVVFGPGRGTTDDLAPTIAK